MDVVQCREVGQETIEYEVFRKGQCMAQSHDAKKDVKKKAQKTLKEKQLEKKMKKAGRTP